MVFLIPCYIQACIMEQLCGGQQGTVILQITDYR